MSFSFGGPSSAPATGLSAGFNFGANKPATPGFPLGATSQPSTGLFGSNPATLTPAFGSTPAPAFGSTPAPAFGSTPAPAFGTATPGFGAAATPAFGTSTPAFGSTATPNFGATATPNFGATSAPGFGATSTPAFGSTLTPAFGATSTPAFGAASAPGFGATSTAPAFGTSGLNFGSGTNTGLNFGAPGTTPSAGLGLGGYGFASTQGTATQSTGFGLHGTTTTTSSSGLFGPKLETTNVTGTQPSIAGAPSLGLGGVAPATSGIGVTTTGSDSKEQQPKQNKLPNELMTSVDSFKEFVKKQKSLSSDVMRVSTKPLHKVAREAEETLRAVLSLSGEVGKARAQSRRLRTAAAKALAAAEQAARDIPGSALEGVAPPSYVQELIAELEQQLITFRRQMDVADKQMQATPKLLSEQELTTGIRRMHESFVALASRLQATHAQVEAQKGQYLNLRKYILKDPTNVFENNNDSTSLDQILRDAEGNRKKTKLFGYADGSPGSAVLSDPRAALGSIQQLAGPTPFTYIGNSGSPYTPGDTGSRWYQLQSQPNFGTSLNTSGYGITSLGTDTASSFQLQKPPKRGKQ